MTIVNFLKRLFSRRTKNFSCVAAPRFCVSYGNKAVGYPNTASINVGPASPDFALDTTRGGGASLRGAGFPPHQYLA